jgi:hypothetical protein
MTHPIRSNLVGCVALLFALGGGAYAVTIAPRHPVAGHPAQHDLSNKTRRAPSVLTDFDPILPALGSELARGGHAVRRATLLFAKPGR